MKKICISVSNDLSNDQRVGKMCQSLQKLGLQPILIGRILPESVAITDRDYKTIRWNLWFNRGFLFYGELNIRLFIYLLFTKVDILYSNDLDTLSANYLVSKIRKLPLIYDSHEYFTEVPELKGRFAKKVWTWIEAHILPNLNTAFTVSDGIADAYQQKYGIEMTVVRNLPRKSNSQVKVDAYIELPAGMGEKFILLQGAGINIERGAEELIEAMGLLDEVQLLIVGGGDVLPELKRRVNDLNLHSKVFFMPKQPPHLLKLITAKAQLGISLDKDTNLNYRFSLPNKIFDYIQAGIPVLASNLVEVSKIVEQFQIGLICPNHKPEIIAQNIKKMLNEDYKNMLAANLKIAAEELNWENQESQIFNAIKPYI